MPQDKIHPSGVPEMHAIYPPYETRLTPRIIPATIGSYDLGGIEFNLTRKPHWLARQLCRWLLDWRWTDA